MDGLRKLSSRCGNIPDSLELYHAVKRLINQCPTAGANDSYNNSQTAGAAQRSACEGKESGEASGKNAHKTVLYPFPLPTSSTRILRKDNFIVSYDQAKRIPQWVAETITKDSILGMTKRAKKFGVDNSIPVPFRSTTSDYRGSGFDRGHMAPAGNNKNNAKVMKQSFLLSNVVPQNHQQNAGIWNELEIFCRELTQDWDVVHIITGHVMRPTTKLDSCGNRVNVVKYQVIGANEVAVPTHLYKIVLCQRDISKRTREDAITAEGTSPRPAEPNYPYPFERPKSAESTFNLQAFLIPNSEVSDDKRFLDFRIALTDVERFAGIEFFGVWRKRMLETSWDD